MSNLPTVFLSAASEDLKNWRDLLHVAFTRAGCHVYTQGHSLSSPTGDVIRLLRADLDKSEFVIHLAGIAYGAEPERPAFPDHPEFHCSYTQFEYYYAHQQEKQVIAFVCSEDFPFLPFTEKAKNAVDAQQSRLLQQAHRDRVTTGKFSGTPLEGRPYRPLSKTIADFNVLVEEVAAAVGKILEWTQDQTTAVQRELRDLPRQLADELERRGFNTRNAECQPRLVPSITLDASLGLPSIRDLKFRYRWLPYLERFDEFDALGRFLHSPTQFCWWGLVGKGGCGKSRLAFELVETCLKDADRWEAGFLLSSESDWLVKRSRGWLPKKQTLIVVDYASQHAGNIREVLLNLANLHTRAPFAPKVRLLLLDRPGALGPLFSDLTFGDRTETDVMNAAARQTLFREPSSTPVDRSLSFGREKGDVLIGAGELLEIGTMPRSRWPEVLQATLKRSNPSLPQLPPASDESWWNEVGRITGQGRLLYLQVLGVLLAERPELITASALKAGRDDLLQAILNREFELHWPSYFLDTDARGKEGKPLLRDPLFKKVKKAVAFVTLTRGLRLPEQLASLQQVVPMTEGEVEQVLSVLPRILHPQAAPENDALVSDVQPSYYLAPLEPDPIGESLVLDAVHGSLLLKSGSSNLLPDEETHRWLRAAVAANRGTFEAIENLVKDFPLHPGAERWCVALLSLTQDWMDALERNPDDKDQLIRLDVAAEHTACIWVEFLKMQPSMPEALVSAMAAQAGRHLAFATRVFKYFIDAIHEESSWKQNYSRLHDLVMPLLNLGYFQFTFMGVISLARWAGKFKVYGSLRTHLEWLRLSSEDVADDLWAHAHYAEALPAAMIVFGQSDRREDFDFCANELERVAARWPNERDIQKELVNGIVNAGAYYGQIKDRAAVERWASHLSRMAREFSKDVAILHILSQATWNMYRAYEKFQDVQAAQHWRREHLVARRAFARGMVLSQARYGEEGDMKSVGMTLVILQGWADAFPDDPILQGELVLGLYESLLAPGEADFQRASPLLERVGTALRNSAMDPLQMNYLIAKVALKTDRPELTNYGLVLYAYLSIYWPGFVSDVFTSREALALLFRTRSCSREELEEDEPQHDSEQTWQRLQKLSKTVQESSAKGVLPSKEQVIELWQGRMYLSDRGDSLLHALERLALENAIVEYHADPWRREDSKWNDPFN